jgi:hypothetical protein
MIEWIRGEHLSVSGGEHEHPTYYVVDSVQVPGEIEELRRSNDPQIEEVRLLFQRLDVGTLAWINTADECGVPLVTAVLLCADGCARDMHGQLLTVQELERAKAAST